MSWGTAFQIAMPARCTRPSGCAIQAQSAPELSVEQDIAETLGWKIGHRIAFDVAGQRLDARITSLRKVDWASFKPNFFVLAPS